MQQDMGRNPQIHLQYIVTRPTGRNAWVYPRSVRKMRCGGTIKWKKCYVWFDAYECLWYSYCIFALVWSSQLCVVHPAGPSSSSRFQVHTMMGYNDDTLDLQSTTDYFSKATPVRLHAKRCWKQKQTICAWSAPALNDPKRAAAVLEQTYGMSNQWSMMACTWTDMSRTAMINAERLIIRSSSRELSIRDLDWKVMCC